MTRADHSPATVQAAHAFLDAHLGQRQVNRILHGFPSPRFWQPGAVSVPDVMRQREDWNAESPSSLSV